MTQRSGALLSPTMPQPEHCYAACWRPWNASPVAAQKRSRAGHGLTHGTERCDLDSTRLAAVTLQHRESKRHPVGPFDDHKGRQIETPVLIIDGTTGG